MATFLRRVGFVMCVFNVLIMFLLSALSITASRLDWAAVFAGAMLMFMVIGAGMARRWEFE